jgi:hypothetical protein
MFLFQSNWPPSVASRLPAEHLKPFSDFAESHTSAADGLKNGQSDRQRKL